MFEIRHVHLVYHTSYLLSLISYLFSLISFLSSNEFLSHKSNNHNHTIQSLLSESHSAASAAASAHIDKKPTTNSNSNSSYPLTQRAFERTFFKSVYTCRSLVCARVGSMAVAVSSVVIISGSIRKCSWISGGGKIAVVKMFGSMCLRAFTERE